MPPAALDRNETRVLGADGVRAAACLMVFAHHWFKHLSPDAFPQSLRGLYNFGFQGAFGVAAFFVLSGFLLSRPFWKARDLGAPLPSLRTYAWRRVARILPGYWLALTASFVVGIVVFGEEANRSLVSRFFSGVLFLSDWHWKTLFPVDHNGPLWSISFEITSYILLPLALGLLFLIPGKATWAARAVWSVILIAVVGIHMLIVAYLPVDRSFTGWEYGLLGGANYWTPRFNPIGFFAIFGVGVLAAGVQVRLAKSRSSFFDLAAIAGVIAAVVVATSTFPYSDGLGPGYRLASLPYSFPWFALAVAIILIAAPSSRWFGRIADNPLTVFLARISFGIYVWHALVIEIIRHSFVLRLVDGRMVDLNQWLSLVGIGFGVSVAVATVSFYAMEQPIIRLARRLEVNAREARLPRGHGQPDTRAMPAAGS